MIFCFLGDEAKTTFTKREQSLLMTRSMIPQALVSRLKEMIICPN